jgi:hypothetical protein
MSVRIEAAVYRTGGVFIVKKISQELRGNQWRLKRDRFLPPSRLLMHWKECFGDNERLHSLHVRD